MDSKDQKLIAEAYNKVLEAAITPRDEHKNYSVPDAFNRWAQGYKTNLDHIKVEPYYYCEFDKQTIFRVREYTKDNQLISVYFYRQSPEAFNDDQTMYLTSTDITNMLPDNIKKEIRKQAQEYEINKYNVDRDVKDKWKIAVNKL